MPATASIKFWKSEITLTLDHDATVKAPLEHLAFMQPQGPCSEPLTDALVADFTGSGVTVVDRLHLKALMAEHKLNVGGTIDEKTAAKIGRLVGTGSLVFVKVYECKTYHTRESSISLNGQRATVPTTRGLLRGSVQIINMTTGVTMVAPALDARVALQNGDGDSSVVSRATKAMAVWRNDREKDPFPPDEDAQSRLFDQVVDQIHKMLFAWTERKTFTFYDDKECSLNAAYKLMQAADFEGAAREAETSVAACKGAGKQVVLARAFFNSGMALYLSRDYDTALMRFNQAAHLEPSKIISDVMAECRRAKLNGPKPTKAAAAKPDADERKQSTTPAGTVEERLHRIDELHKRGMITDEEYAQKRKQILSGL
jgi:hypothetical protein